MRKRRSCAGVWVFRAAILTLLLASAAEANTVEITIDGPAGTLAGTLERAPGPHAALILPGSGPTDRNGNQIANGLVPDSYRLLAEALAAGGVSTLRTDKRGIGDSGGDGNAVSLAAYRDDAEAWIAALQAETGADCVWLIGHSEGGTIALFSANLPGVCGLILLTAPGRALGPILMEQLAAQPGFSAHAAAMERALDQLSVGLAPDIASLPPDLAALFDPALLGYMTELVSTDPAELARPLDLPILAITGDADIQVREDEAARLVAANPAIRAVVMAGLTHTLKQVPPGDRAQGLLTYSDPSRPLHPDLAPTLLAFMAESR